MTRGSGWQHTGAYINLGAYYLAGIPVALVLSFVLHLGGKGLWTGLIVGSIVQFVLLFLLTSFTNWQQQVTFHKFPCLICEVVLDRVSFPDDELNIELYRQQRQGKGYLRERVHFLPKYDICNQEHYLQIPYCFFFQSAVELKLVKTGLCIHCKSIFQIISTG